MNYQNREIPGTIAVEGREFRYISDDGLDKFEEELFDRILNQLDVPIAQNGGVISENCKLWLPTGDLYHGLSYKGDINGWRKEIEQGAAIIGLHIGMIVNGSIKLLNGREFKLSDCKVEFY